jgi:hypothetical protein
MLWHGLRKRRVAPGDGVGRARVSFQPRPLFGVVEKPAQLREHGGGGSSVALEDLDSVEPGDDCAGFVHAIDGTRRLRACLCRICDRCSIESAMKWLWVLALAAVTLVPTASAKAPPAGFRICGDHECAAIVGDDAEELAIRLFYSGSPTLWNAPPPESTFFALHWRWSDGEPEQTAYYAVDAHMLRMAPHASGPIANPFGWTIVDATAQAVLDRITASLEPFHGAVVSAARVGGRAVRDPASYARLWSVGTPRTYYRPTPWLHVKLTTNVASPWAGELDVARKVPFLLRDQTMFRIPQALAIRIRARASLR